MVRVARRRGVGFASKHPEDVRMKSLVDEAKAVWLETRFSAELRANVKKT